MSHRDVLKQLFPLELAGDFEADLELEGQQLDAVQARSEDLLLEMFPDTADELLPDWERICGITNTEGKPIQSRRDAVVAQLNAIGPSSRQDFIDLAANLGHTISIEEFAPFRVGISRMGDRLYPEEIQFVWKVTMTEQGLYYFTVGVSRMGDPLIYTDKNALEVVILRLKPAHTLVVFEYT